MDSGRDIAKAKAKANAKAKAKPSSALSFSLLLFSWTNEVNWIVPCLDSGLRVASKKIVLSVHSEELRLASAYALAKVQAAIQALSGVKSDS